MVENLSKMIAAARLRFWPRESFIVTSNGVTSASLPAITDRDGKWDASLLDDADIQAVGDARYAQLAANNVLTGSNTFSPTVGQEVMRWESIATNDNPLLAVTQGRGTTANATPATLRTVAINANKTVYIKAVVMARRTGGAAGTADDGAVYVKAAAYTTKTGTVTQLGTMIEDIDREDVAGWNCALVISGTNVIVQVTGAANTNIVWHINELRYSEVGT